MGMTSMQLNMIRAIAENKMAEAKKYAIACCAEDTTQKNAYYTKKYKNMLESNPTMIELPYNIKGSAQMEDVSTSFREDRYYLSKREQELFNQISKMNNASLKLMEMGIPYLNAILLTGTSGTGKTTFGRYVAFKLGLPFLYINFSYLIESLMGKTSQNLRAVFDFAKTTKCLLMLDEIDCIAGERKGANSGAEKELNNTTISLLQELDQIRNDSIIIGATNIPEIIDPAVKRRFSIQHEVKPLSKEENIEMITQYLNTVDLSYDNDDIVNFVDNMNEYVNTNAQAIVLNYIISKIAESIIENRDYVKLI